LLGGAYCGIFLHPIPVTIILLAEGVQNSVSAKIHRSI
jgi:hypothetical protein